MFTIEEVGIMLDEIVDSLPHRVYSDLNGGVLLLPDTKIHPESRNRDLFVLGEYHANWQMGKYIVFYFGSINKVYGYLNKEQFKEKLTDILWHELTHHLEFLAGERGLEIKDARDMELYRRQQK
ncbi:MAG: metallopeptidase family protein [Syntrophomonadaceae bacterium]|nr:metallopeptidase family protein [Syntrophomonadaceae bacterium]